MQKSFSHLILFLAVSFSAFPMLAQTDKAPGQPFSLKDCVTYSLEHNTDVRKQNLVLLKSQYQVKEARTAGLPQVSASAQVLDNLIIGKQLLPGDIFGQPGTFIPVKFGVQYSIPLRVEANQVIFNKQLQAGIESAKAAEQLNQVNQLQIQENVAYNIATSYYSALVTGEQRKIVQANLEKIGQSVQVAQVQYDNQMIRRIDLDQLRVSQSNTRSELDQVKLGYAQTLDMLKIVMGYPLSDTLILATENLQETLLNLPENETESNPILMLQDRQTTLKALEIKGIQAKYYPTVGMFANYGYQSQFDKVDDMIWIKSAVVGVSVNIPIFDGFTKKRQVQQRNIDLQTITLDRELAKNQLDAQYQNAVRNYRQNLRTIENQQENLDLAQNVYTAIQNNYKNGIATLSDLINADTGLRTAQTQFLTAQLQVRISALDVFKANGNVSNILIQ